MKSYFTIVYSDNNSTIRAIIGIDNLTECENYSELKTKIAEFLVNSGKATNPYISQVFILGTDVKFINI